MVYGMVTNMSKVDKIKAKWTKPGTRMKRVQEIETKAISLKDCIWKAMDGCDQWLE
nr:hypothetical protein [Tanacetum cinerariifolium]